MRNATEGLQSLLNLQSSQVRILVLRIAVNKWYFAGIEVQHLTKAVSETQRSGQTVQVHPLR